MSWKSRTVKEAAISLFLYTFLGLFSCRILLLSNGTLGFFHDWFIGPFPEMISQYGHSGFQVYDMSFGNKIYPSDWLFRVFFIPFSFFGGEAISRGMLIFLLTLSGFSMFCFGRRTLKLNYYWSLIAGLIYIFSPIIFTRAVAGYIYYLIGYSLTPLLLTAFCKALETKEKKAPYAIISGVLFGLVGVQIQFFIMISIILLLLILMNYKNLKNGLLSLILTVMIGLFLHFPWILTLVATRPQTVTLATQFLSYHEIVSSPTLLESIRVIGYKIHPYSYTNLIAQGIIPGWILLMDFLMPIIAVATLIWKRNKYTMSFALTLVVGIFLSKGISPPFETLFKFLFNYTPLVIFRELWHIAFLVFFPYAVLTSTALQEITGSIEAKIHRLKAYALTTILAIIIIVSNGYPLLLGDFGGYMQTYSLSEDYHNLYETLQKDISQYRILWLPSISPIKYDNKSLPGVDPLIQYSPKPTFTQHIIPQSPLSRLNMFLTSTIYENKTQQFGKLLSPLATRYMVLRNDFMSEYPRYVPLGLYPELSKKWEPTVTSNFIINQQDIRMEYETLEFKLYQNTNPSEFIYTPTTIAYGTDDLSTLIQLVKIANLTDIAYITDMEELEISNPIFILKNDGFDIVPIITGVKIDPGNYVTETDPQKGWINSKNWFWYNYLFASTINNGAFTKTNSRLSIPIELKSSSEIWAKILKWQNGGKVAFTLNNGKESTITTISNAFTLEWIKLFDENSNQTVTLTISNIDGENYVDKILILNKQRAGQVLTSKLRNATIIYIIDPGSFEINSVMNPSFEELKDGYPLYWSSAETGFTATTDNQTANQGCLSLKVTTSINSPWHWSWIRSSEIPVTSSEYLIITYIKQENAKSSHIVIEGLNKTTNTWVQLIQVPAGQDGSYDWKAFKTNLRVNKDITLLRMALNAGWVLDETKGNATTWFDNLSITPKQEHSNDILLAVNVSAVKNLTILKEANYKIFVEILGNAEITISNQTFNINSSQYKIINVGSIYLKNGSYELRIKALENTHIGALWIYESPQDTPAIKEVFLEKTGRAKILDQRQESPTLWKAKVNATTPFLLAFAAPYDHGWCIYVSDEKYRSIPLYGFINGFYINQTGLIEIVIEYEPQKWFYIGSIISATILIACTTYLIYDWTRNKAILERIKKKIKAKTIILRTRNN